MGEVWVNGKPGRHQERDFPVPGGHAVPFRHWAVPEPVGAICHLHGQGEHSGPFAAMADLLADAGFAVYAHDHRGFGRSKAARGDIDSFDTYIADAMAMVRLARREVPNRPVFLMGLSMGGQVALRAAARLRGSIAGVVALSPGFRLKNTPLRAMLLTLWYLLFRPGQLMPSVIEGVQTTRNQAHLERADADPTYVRAFTARFYFQNMLSVRRAWHDVTRIQVPVLVIAGAADPLVDPWAARRYFDRLPAKDKEFRLLDGAYHNLPAEPNMPEIADAVADWLRARLS